MFKEKKRKREEGRRNRQIDGQRMRYNKECGPDFLLRFSRKLAWNKEVLFAGLVYEI